MSQSYDEQSDPALEAEPATEPALDAEEPTGSLDDAAEPLGAETPAETPAASDAAPMSNAIIQATEVHTQGDNEAQAPSLNIADQHERTGSGRGTRWA